MFAPALYVLLLFLGLSLMLGVLVAVHDGIEYLVTRRPGRRRAHGGGGQLATGQLPAGQWVGYGVPASGRRAPRQLPVVAAPARREQPSWYDAASRDALVREGAVPVHGSRPH